MATPDKFVAAVRANEIPQPSQVKHFSEAAWASAYAKLQHSGTSADARLFEAGKWFAPRFRMISQKAAELRFREQDPEKLIRFHIGATNRAARLIFSMGLVDVDKEGVLVAEQLLQGRYETPTGPARPDDLLEASVDGLKIALDSLRSARESATNDSPAEEVDKIRLHINYGILFGVLVTTWNHCLWNSWWVDQTGNRDIIRAPNDDMHVSRATSKYRSDALTNEALFHIRTLWSRMPAHTKRAALTRRPHVLSIEGSGDGKRFVYGHRDDEPPLPPIEFCMRFIAEELFFAGLLDESLPSQPDLTLRRLLDVWEVLAEISRALIARTPQQHDCHNVRRLLEYCPSVREADLVAAIQRCLGYPIGQARSSLKFFIKLGNGPDADYRTELWHKPIIVLDSKRLIPVLGPLATPNLVRSIEHWTAQGGLSLERRGPAFERHAREALSEAIARSPHNKTAGVVRHSVTVSFPEGVEQLDIVAWIGRTALLGEAKCILFPTSPHDQHKYFQTIRRAVRQVKRKAMAAKQRLDLLGAAMADQTRRSDAPVRVVPFVLLSVPFGVGTSIEGIPVVDVGMLGRYFEKGDIDRFVLLDPKGRKLGGQKIKFYERLEDAEANIGDFLNSPPAVAQYRPFIEWDVRGFPPLETGGREASIMEPTVHLPFDEATYEPK